MMTLEEIVQLAAVDGTFFESQFFPKTVRQEGAPWFPEVWRLLEGPDTNVNLIAFRGSAKTTRLRLFCAKRIAFREARTILYIGPSEPHAVRSVEWIRKQIAYNRPFSQVFGLNPGTKWQGTQLQISRVDDDPTWVLACGISGSIRGINLDDYRPDTIILDDIIDEETAMSLSPDGRKKLNELIHGAIKNSLAPSSECPHAKLVMLSTPRHEEDPCMLASRDPSWKTKVFSCWTSETEDLAIAERQSSWPARFSSETLRAEKVAEIAAGRSHVFAREKECRLIDVETAPLKAGWLKFWSLPPLREQLSVVVISVDPVPKPTEQAVARGLHNRDFEVLQVWGRMKSDYFLLDWCRNQGHDPGWTRTEFMRLCIKWQPRMVVVDSVAYQTTLVWILKEEMRRQGRYYVVKEVIDKRSKHAKILDTLQGPGAGGAIHVPVGYVDFIDQWSHYPSVSHDDDLDAAYMAVEELSREGYEGEEIYEPERDKLPRLRLVGRAP